MKVTVKIRFDATQEKIEKFSPANYLMYLPFPENEQTGRLIIHLLSRTLGVPPNRLVYSGKDSSQNFVFEVLA